MLAQEIYNKQDEETQAYLESRVKSILDTLYKNEVEYTEDIYSPLGIEDDVKTFIRYNGNKAMDNLGLERVFNEEEVNQIVINGLSNKTKSFDFFSQKGNGYKKATVESIQDSDFIFD